MSHLSFEPLIPPSLWLALAVAGAVLLTWYAWRKPAVVSVRRWVGIISLMTASLALVLALLLNPIRVATIPPPAGKPLLTLLVDATASMQTPDAGGKPRYQAAADTARKLSHSLAEQFDVRVQTFTNTDTTIDIGDLQKRPATGQSTDLAAAIAGALDQDLPQGQAVALLSDGVHNANDVVTVIDTAKLARAMASPIYTETYGGDAGGYDLGVELRTSQELAFLNQKVLITAQITHVGLAGTHPNVVLLQDGKEIGRQQADLAADRPGSAQFWVSRDRVGLYPYEVRVEPLPGEMTQANNVGSFLLRVIDQPIHVLQLEGKPYWDSKFLMRTLAGVPAVELDSAVRVNDARIMWRTIRQLGEEDPATQPAASTQPAIPLGSSAAPSSPASSSPAAESPTTGPSTLPRVEQWKIVNDAAGMLGDPKFLNRYQIVVIGRDAEAFLTDAAVANLQNWVSHSGGAIVCYSGSPTAQANERLSHLLPVKWAPSPEARFHVRMTDQGRDLHWLGDFAEADSISRLPTLASSEHSERSKPLAVVLAQSVSSAGDASPAVTYQPYGSGRVVVIEGAGMWRWAFLPPQYQKQEEVYRSLWHSLLRWLVSGTGLMPGQKMMLRAEKISFATGEPAGVSMLVREEAMQGALPLVQLSGAADEDPKKFAPAPVADQPGTFHIDFGKLPEGRYQARIVGASKNDSFTRTVFDVRPFGEEQLNLTARPDLMQRIADESGGRVLMGDAGESLSSEFAAHLARIRPPRTTRTSAWDRWWILLGIIITWGVSWWLRRSGGLI